jgi:hypothetical protein
MKERSFMVLVMDDEGVTHKHFFWAKSGRHARRAARRWMAHVEWATTIVGVTSMGGHAQRGSARRLLAVGAFMFAVSGVTIAAMMILALSLQGAL